MISNRKSHAQPQLVDVRKPIRPVRVAAVREPVKVTPPIVLESGPTVAKLFAPR